MSKVIVTKSKLDSLADNINTKAETTGAKTIDELTETVNSLSTTDYFKYATALNHCFFQSVFDFDELIINVPLVSDCTYAFSGTNLSAITIKSDNLKLLNYAFNSGKLQHLTIIGDTSKVTSYNSMCIYANILLEINCVLDFSSVTTASGLNNTFSYCYALKKITVAEKTINVSISFKDCSWLYDDSIQSIIDGLADLTGKTAQTLTLHATVKAKLTDEQIAQITSKNWNLA